MGDKYIGTRNNKINISKDDPDLAAYLKERASVTDADIRLYLREVNFHCPLCCKDLQRKRYPQNRSVRSSRPKRCRATRTHGRGKRPFHQTVAQSRYLR